jgi:hypothetical protein
MLTHHVVYSGATVLYTMLNIVLFTAVHSAVRHIEHLAVCSDVTLLDTMLKLLIDTLVFTMPNILLYILM